MTIGLSITLLQNLLVTVHQHLIGEKLYHTFCIEIVKYFLYKEKLKIVVYSKIFIHQSVLFVKKHK